MPWAATASPARKSGAAAKRRPSTSQTRKTPDLTVRCASASGSRTTKSPAKRPATSQSRKAHKSLPNKPFTAAAVLDKIIYSQRPMSASPWDHNITLGAPLAVDRMWESVAKLNSEPAGDAALMPESNAFVDGMEQKLKEDLDESGCLPRGPCPERARIHGVVFEELIERMGPFRDQLARIRFEYDAATCHYEREVTATPRIKAKLATRQMLHERQVMALLADQAPIIKQWEVKLNTQVQEALKVEDRIEIAEGMLREKMAEIRKLNEANKPFEDNTQYLEEWENRYRDEVTAKKKQMKKNAEAIEDIEKQIKQVQSGTRFGKIDKEELVESIISRKVVPRSELDAATEMVNSLKYKMTTVQLYLSRTLSQLEEAHDRHYKLSCRKMQLKAQQGLTPRPKWAQAGDEVKMSLHQTSEENIKTLTTRHQILSDRMQELHGRMSGANGSMDAELQGLGMSSDIPAFLRHAGPVRNLYMSKQQLLTLVRSIWESKSRFDRKRKSPMQLSKYIKLFLRQRYHKPMVGIELAYNLIVTTYAHKDTDAECEVFFKVLVGQLSPEFQQVIVTDVEKIEALAGRADHKDSGQLPQDRLLACIREVFQGFPDAQMHSLQAALEAKFRSDIVQHTLLFADHEDGRTDMFLGVLREMQLQQMHRAVETLAGHVQQLMQREGNMTSVSNVLSAYRKADPAIPTQAARKHVLGILGLPSGVHASDDLTVQLPAFLDALKTLPVPRFSPTPTESLRVSMKSVSRSSVGQGPMAILRQFLQDYEPTGHTRYSFRQYCSDTPGANNDSHDM